MESKFLASQAYGLDKSRFHFFESAFDLVLGLAINLLGWMPWLWDVSAGLVTKAGYEGWGGDIPTSLTFVVLTMIGQVRRLLQARPAQTCCACAVAYGGLRFGCLPFATRSFFLLDERPGVRGRLLVHRRSAADSRIGC